VNNNLQSVFKTKKKKKKGIKIKRRMNEKIKVLGLTFFKNNKNNLYI
jgi:hypothetical protein